MLILFSCGCAEGSHLMIKYTLTSLSSKVDRSIVSVWNAYKKKFQKFRPADDNRPFSYGVGAIILIFLDLSIQLTANRASAQRRVFTILFQFFMLHLILLITHTSGEVHYTFFSSFNFFDLAPFAVLETSYTAKQSLAMRGMLLTWMSNWSSEAKSADPSFTTFSAVRCIAQSGFPPWNKPATSPTYKQALLYNNNNNWLSERSLRFEKIGNFFFRRMYVCMPVCQFSLEATVFKRLWWNMAHAFLDF